MKLGFYAVLGKRDYLKLNNKKVGIWELTEYQPDGWLCSLAIKPEVMPQNSPIIHDCGAFGYREQDYPTINSLLTRNGQPTDIESAAVREIL